MKASWNPFNGKVQTLCVVRWCVTICFLPQALLGSRRAAIEAALADGRINFPTKRELTRRILLKLALWRHVDHTGYKYTFGITWWISRIPEPMLLTTWNQQFHSELASDWHSMVHWECGRSRCYNQWMVNTVPHQWVILIRNPIFSENPGVSLRPFETRPQSAESACLVMLVESPVGHESSSAEHLLCGTTPPCLLATDCHYLLHVQARAWVPPLYNTHCASTTAPEQQFSCPPATASSPIASCSLEEDPGHCECILEHSEGSLSTIGLAFTSACTVVFRSICTSRVTSLLDLFEMSHMSRFPRLLSETIWPKWALIRQKIAA